MEVSPPDAPPHPDVEAARRGDRAAFGRLFRQHGPVVHGVLLARVRATEADDLMQEVFLTALEKIGTLREGAAFGGWLCTIARNRAADHHRSRRNLVEIPEDLAGRPDAERAEAERVLRAIRSLPEAYHETLVLRLVEGLTGPEIAEQVGITPESVRVNLHRGMKMLREKLGLGGDGG
jgi:RNA polymerase sigma-70 factor (ECF subfamily)